MPWCGDSDEFDVGGTGSLNDLWAAPEPRPRLAGMRSVSEAAAQALHRAPVIVQRTAGFVQRRPR